MTLVSVITPSYNSPDIYATIESVLSQSYSNIQYIIVDDGSEDFDEQKVRAYIDKNNRGNVSARVIVNPNNMGTVRAMNTAMRAATGEYIINLAGDDCFYDKDVVADIVSEFEKSGAEIITGLRLEYDRDIKKVLRLRPKRAQCKLIEDSTPKELFEAMSSSNFIFGCCTARSKACVEKYGLYDEKYRLIEDYSMNMKLLRNNVRFHFFERVFVKYRSGGVSFASNLNTEYMLESDEIFKNEIMPFCFDADAASASYFAWKENAQKIARLYAEMSQGGIRAFIKALEYSIRNPKHPLKIMYLKFEEFINGIKYGH